MIRLGRQQQEKQQERAKRTQAVLIEAARSGDLDTIQSLHRQGVDLAFEHGALLRAAIQGTEKKRKKDVEFYRPAQVVDYLINAAGMDPNRNIQLKDRPILKAIIAEKWNLARLLLVFGAQYRDILEYAQVLNLSKPQMQRLEKIVDCFRKNYLLKILKALEEQCATNSNLPALIMSYNYPLEFKISGIQ
jgi:hypothetical protein